jgi:hypothetical protein
MGPTRGEENSDILGFTATFKLHLPEDPEKTPKNLLWIVKSLP